MAVSFQLRRLGRCCGAFPFDRRSSRCRLGDAVTETHIKDSGRNARIADEVIDVVLGVVVSCKALCQIEIRCSGGCIECDLKAVVQHLAALLFQGIDLLEDQVQDDGNDPRQNKVNDRCDDQREEGFISDASSDVPASPGALLPALYASMNPMMPSTSRERTAMMT